jgi:acyl carrier protein
MWTSSRAPEGALDRCPVCGGAGRIDPSLPFGAAPCPKCGTLLWFVGFPQMGHMLFEYEAAEALRERVMEVLAAYLRVSRRRLESDPTILARSRVDSLDMVELAMALEEEFGLSGGGPGGEP